MTLTLHAVMGAGIGTAISSPALAGVASFIAHLLVDMIPHGDRALYEAHVHNTVGAKLGKLFVLLDTFCVMVLLMWFFESHHPVPMSVTVGIIAGLLPDILVGIQDVLETKYLAWFYRLHFWFHNSLSNHFGDIPLSWSLTLQFIIVLMIQQRIG